MSSIGSSARTYRFTAALLVVLWSFATLWLAGGVAHADDTGSKDSSPKGSSQSSSASGSEKSDTEKADTAKPVKKPHGTRKHDTEKSAAAAKPDPKPDSTSDPKPAAKTSKTAKKAAASIAATTDSAPTLKPAAADPSITPSATALNPIQRAQRFVGQMTGLANDVTLLAVTVVNNLAAAAAAAIGTKPFFGVPYHVATSIAGAAATVGKLVTGTPLDADSTVTGPFKVTYGVGDLLNFFNPNKPPAGANDPSITVTAAHPLPIILIAGTAANAPFNWSVGAPLLADAGYKVYTFNYGNVTDNPNWPIRGTADIPSSAQELSDEVDKVLAETGADKVILIGHSQGGGLTPEYYLNNLGGADKVSQFIGIAPGNHGADLSGLAYLQYVPVIGKPIFDLVNLLGPAWLQQAIGSPLLPQVYGAGDTRPGVLYTTITTKDDWIVTPYTNQALDGPNVTNVVLQDLYPGFDAGRLGIVFAKPTWDVVLGALAANPAANPAAAGQSIPVAA